MESNDNMVIYNNRARCYISVSLIEKSIDKLAKSYEYIDESIRLSPRRLQLL